MHAFVRSNWSPTQSVAALRFCSADQIENIRSVAVVLAFQILFRAMLTLQALNY